MEAQPVAQPYDPAFAIILDRMTRRHLRAGLHMLVDTVERLEDLQAEDERRIDRRCEGI